MLWFVVGISATPAWSADPKPKAYVITGWNNGGWDKAWDDWTAAEAKSDLENAGYEVTVIFEATGEQLKNAVKDSSAKALVFIDHGSEGMESLSVWNTDGTEDVVIGGELPGPYSNFDIVTIHACDQDQQSWKDKFPKANFHAWAGSVSGHSIYWWQLWNDYPAASNPTQGTTSITTHPVLTENQFQETALGTLYSINSPSGNWQMATDLAADFGELEYDFILLDDDLTNPKGARLKWC